MNLVKQFYLIFQFLIYYLKLLFLANFRIVTYVLRPGLIKHSGFVRIALHAKNDFEILAFTNLVTMTPGTVILDISSDKRFVYLHVMNIEDLERQKRHLEIVLQERIYEVLRW